MIASERAAASPDVLPIGDDGEREALANGAPACSVIAETNLVRGGAAATPANRGQWTGERGGFLSTDKAGPREVRLAVMAVLVSSMIFAAGAPFAKIPLGHMPAFVSIHVSALVICDVMTAVLLFGQFNFLRFPALLVLASGYLFTALISASYALMFPGLFWPAGLPGAGPQSTSAMYMFWHTGFPLAVTGYALLKGKANPGAWTSGPPPSRGHRPVVSSVALVITIVCGLTICATAGHDYLPVFLQGDRTTDLGRAVLTGDWMLSLLALTVLWYRRPHTVIDLSLMVVLCAWLSDIALGAILNTGRYDLGWYAGRIYGLLAASCVLAVLLIENSNHYVRLARMSAHLRTANAALEKISQQDALTGLANRRCFDTYLASQIAVARRHGRTLALVMCDVDSFKTFNDHYGHQAGDECLKHVAAALRSCCGRSADMVARYGGEEFALILPDTDLDGAVRIAEAARAAVAGLCIAHDYSPIARCVSVSGGVAVLRWKADLTARQLITEADQNLYHAKHLGRNRVVAGQTEHA